MFFLSCITLPMDRLPLILPIQVATFVHRFERGWLLTQLGRRRIGREPFHATVLTGSHTQTARAFTQDDLCVTLHRISLSILR